MSCSVNLVILVLATHVGGSVIQVVMTRWRPSGIPDWSKLRSEMSMMWTNLSWQRNIYVDNRQVEGLPAQKRPLSSELEARTSRICAICDPEGQRSYPSHKSLLRHMETQHQRSLCEVCLQVIKLHLAGASLA